MACSPKPSAPKSSELRLPTILSGSIATAKARLLGSITFLLPSNLYHLKLLGCCVSARSRHVLITRRCPMANQALLGAACANLGIGALHGGIGYDYFNQGFQPCGFIGKFRESPNRIYKWRQLSSRLERLAVFEQIVASRPRLLRLSADHP